MRTHIGICILTAVALAFYVVRALAEQARYATTGYDLGIFDQAVRAYAHFRAPMVALKGSGANILGDHFHPIIALLAPLYWLWDSPNMLLIAQAVLTAATLPVVYRFTRRRASTSVALGFAAIFAFGWGVQSLIDFDFHEVAFATPLLALAIDALDRRNDRQLILWASLLLFVREDMGVLVAVLAVLLVCQRRSNRRWLLPIGIFAAGVAAYILTTHVLIPHFATGHEFAYNSQFGALGSSVTSALANCVTHPWLAIHTFFTPYRKTQTLLLLLVPFAFLPLRSRYALIALPLLAERFFNTRSNLWMSAFHYNALPWLIFTLAAADAGARFGLFRDRRWAILIRRPLVTLMVLAPLAFIQLGSHVGVLPFTELRGPAYQVRADWLASAKAVVAYLPSNVCVVADNHLVPHLTNRDRTTVAESNPPMPDFVALDTDAPDTGGNPPAPKPDDVIAAALSLGYRTVFSAGPFEVLQSPTYTGPSEQCRPLGTGKPESLARLLPDGPD
ncbi:MAG: DUF2079 domain-containing protein [Jatrophihabitantaceae bacterium]